MMGLGWNGSRSRNHISPDIKWVERGGVSLHNSLYIFSLSPGLFSSSHMCITRFTHVSCLIGSISSSSSHPPLLVVFFVPETVAVVQRTSRKGKWCVSSQRRERDNQRRRAVREMKWGDDCCSKTTFSLEFPWQDSRLIVKLSISVETK